MWTMDNKNNQHYSNEDTSGQEMNGKQPEVQQAKGEFSPPTLDPLQIDLVVERIMTFLNIRDLKSARLVCKLWSAEGREQLSSKYYLCARLINQSNQIAKKNFEKFLSRSKASTMFKCYGRATQVLDVLEKFPKFAERVRLLKYKKNYQHDARVFRGLEQVLGKLPNLEILDTNCLYLDHLLKFLSTLKSLEDIRLNFPLNTVSTNLNFMALAGTLKNVSKITLDKPDVLIVNFMVYEEVEWPLHSVSWKFGKSTRQINQHSTRQFFIKNSDTLKHLNIEMLIDFEKASNLTKQTPWEDDWLIPVNFQVLETMTISGSDENIWSLLTIALQLPRLKKLVLTNVPLFVDRKVKEWEEHSLAAGKKLQSLSIEEVELCRPMKFSSSILLKGKLWPNLKSLKLNLNNSSGILASDLFSYWKSLERLELNLKPITLAEFALCQEWLMGGVQYPRNYENGSVIVNSPDVHSSSTSAPVSKLVDLKKLQSLTLHFPLPGFSLGDFLAYNCFQFMTNLQSLYFYGEALISTKASRHLTSALDGLVLFNGRRVNDDQ